MRTGFRAMLFFISLYFFIISVFIVAAKINYYNTKSDYEEALDQATWDATAVLLETKKESAENLTYEGYTNDEADIEIDYNEVIDRFYRTLWYNLGLYNDVTAQGAFKERIAFKGIIGNKAISICLWNENWLPPVPYSYYCEDNKTIYNYTLGDEVQYFNTVTGVSGWDKIDNIPSPVDKLTHRQWRQIVVMDTINKAFSETASSELSMQAENQHMGVKFMLNQAEDSDGNVITSPGVFAVIDGVAIGYQEPMRTFSFAGVQMQLK